MGYPRLDPDAYPLPPLGLDAAAPTTPSAPSFFQDYDTAMRPALDARKKAVTDNYSAIVDMTQSALDTVKQMQNPIAPMPVPTVNPLMASLAGFFSNLNASQTGVGTLPAMVANQVSNVQAQGARATEANAEAASRFSVTKASATEDLQMQLLKAKRDAAMQMGDLEATFQANKALYALERQKRKEDIAWATEAAKTKTAATNQSQLDLIKERGNQSRITARLVASLKTDATTRATTPAQKARLSLANAQVAELRAQVDDFRGERDAAGEPLHSEDEIASMEQSIQGQIRSIYAQAIQDFEQEKAGGTVAPGSPGTPASQQGQTNAGTNSRVQAAADRLRGTPLFTQ